MENVHVVSLQKMKHAFEQIRRQGNDHDEERQIEIYLGAVHWVNELFEEPKDKNLQIDAAYHNFLSTYQLDLGEETQQLMLFSDEDNAEAFGVINAVKRILGEFWGDLLGISVHGRSLGKLFSKKLNVNVREMQEEDLPQTPLENSDPGNLVVTRSFENIDSYRAGTPVDRSFINWCSFLFWVSQCHDQADLKATSQFIVNDDLAKSYGEVVFQEWYKLGAPAKWVAAGTISRFEEDACSLKQWTAKCDANSGSRPIAISCSLKNDLIDASLLAVDYLLQHTSGVSAKPIRKSIERKLARGKMLKLTGVDEIVFLGLCHLHGYPDGPISNEAKSQSEISKVSKVSQPAVTRFLKKIRNYEVEKIAGGREVQNRSALPSPQKWYSDWCESQSIWKLLEKVDRWRTEYKPSSREVLSNNMDSYSENGKG